MWFWHTLALALGKTVGELQAITSDEEFAHWVAFFRQHPFDDRHRYHRPAALIAQAGTDIDARLHWLEPDPGMAEMNDADMRTMRAFGFTRKH